MKAREIILVLLGILFLPLTGEAGSPQPASPPFDPSQGWRMLPTEHFLVVFPAELLPWAEEAGKIAERSYDFWTQELQYSPTEKTFIILSDQSDVAAARTSLFPHNVIAIDHPFGFFREPFGMAVELEKLIFSEYGRIVDQTRVADLTADLRAILGKLVAPGLIKPWMIREGLAELALRGSASAERIVRPLVQANRWPTLAQLSAPYSKQSWPPAAEQARAMGGLLLHYLYETYGQEILQKLSQVHAERPLSSITMGALTLVTGRAAGEIYQDFQAWMQQRFHLILQEIEAQGGMTPSHPISFLGFFNLWPAWSPSGASIIYYHEDPQRLSGLRWVRRDGRDDRALVNCRCGPPTWLDENTLIYPKLTLSPKNELFYDLFRYDLQTGREERLTHRERIYLIEPFPDGRRVLVARNESQGHSSLLIFDLRLRSRLILKEFAADQRLHSIAVSLDGQQVALSLWKSGQGLDIYLMDSRGGSLTAITQDPAVDLDPTFSDDGSYVLFSSEREGVFDLYAYHLEDRRLLRVTRSLFGSFDPAVAPDGGQLLFVTYGPEGFRIHSAEYDPTRWETIAQAPRSAHAASRQRVGNSNAERLQYPAMPYDAGSALLPTFWLPLVGSKHLGMFTKNEDPLRQHRYELTFAVDLESREIFSELRYENSQRTPTIHLRTQGTPTRQLQELALEFELGRSLSARRVFLLGVRQQLGIPELFLQAAISELRGADLFRRDSSLSIEGGAKRLSQRLGRRLAIDWQEKLQLPWANLPDPHQIWFHVRAAWSDHEPYPLLGGVGGIDPLRGYEAQLLGSQLMAVTAEYRFPIWAIEWACCGDSPWPILLDDLRGSLFIDAGAAGATLEPSQVRVGFGLELQLKLVLGYGLAQGWLRFGLAYGLGRDQPHIYFRLGPEF